jgi:hypothetical protein
MAKDHEQSTTRRKPRKKVCSNETCKRKAAPRRTKCWGCLKSNWREEHPYKNLIARMRTRATTKNIPFDLTVEDLKELTSGLDLSGDRRHKEGLQFDRVEPWKGYVRGNVQMLTTSENAAKGNRERRDPRNNPFYEEEPKTYAEASAHYGWY